MRGRSEAEENGMEEPPEARAMQGELGDDQATSGAAHPYCAHNQPLHQDCCTHIIFITKLVSWLHHSTCTMVFNVMEQRWVAQVG